MHHRSRAAWAALALLPVLPQLAPAGPVQWEYQSQLVRVGDPIGPLRGMIPPDQMGTGGSANEDDFSRLVAGSPGTAWGWRTVQLGAVVPDGLRLDPLNWAPNVFQLTLTLKDVASGQTGTVTYDGRASEDGVFDGPFAMYLLSRHDHATLTPAGDQVLALGGNEYHVSVWTLDHANGTSYIEADVTVGAANATPEPGSLALAGLGIGVIGVRLRRRG